MTCSRLPKLLLPALLLAFCLAPALGAPKRAWAPEDSFALKRVGELQMSPRGDRLLFVLSETSLSDNRRRSALWSLPVDGTEPVALTDPGREAASSPRWSPDGQRIAYFGGGGLWVMAAVGSKKKLVAGRR